MAPARVHSVPQGERRRVRHRARDGDSVPPGGLPEAQTTRRSRPQRRGAESPQRERLAPTPGTSWGVGAVRTRVRGQWRPGRRSQRHRAFLGNRFSPFHPPATRPPPDSAPLAVSLSPWDSRCSLSTRVCICACLLAWGGGCPFCTSGNTLSTLVCSVYAGLQL